MEDLKDVKTIRLISSPSPPLLGLGRQSNEGAGRDLVEVVFKNGGVLRLSGGAEVEDVNDEDDAEDVAIADLGPSPSNEKDKVKNAKRQRTQKQ